MGAPRNGSTHIQIEERGGDVMKKWALIFLLVFIPFILGGCKLSISEDWDSDALANDFVSGKAVSSEICVHEKGVFYLSGELLCYYDYNSDQSFILCSRPNCSHNDTECVAYAGESAVGFAMYGDYAFYFRPVSESLSWELIRVNIQEQICDIVCTFGIPSVSLDQWYVYNVDCVYYNEGYAWAKLHMLYTPAEPTGYNDNGIQMVAINLSTGDLHELTDPLMDMRDYDGITWRIFSDTYVGYEIEQFTPRLMTGDEYEEYCKDNPTETRTYFDYLAETTQNSPYERYWLVDIASMSQRVLYEGYDINSLIWAKGEVLAARVNDGSTETYYQVSIDGKLGDEVFSITNGGALGWFHGEATMRLYDNDSILYLVYEGDERCKIYKYSLETGESTYLFEDDRHVSFRLVGQTSDKLIGKINESSQLAWIYKEDYENGNFDAIHKFNLQ